MDILQHRAAELLDVLQGDGPAVDERLGVQRPQGHGARHAEGDALVRHAHAAWLPRIPAGSANGLRVRQGWAEWLLLKDRRDDARAALAAMARHGADRLVAEALAAARKYHRGEGVPSNFVEAIRFYRLAESRGSVEARRMLGLIYSRPMPDGSVNAGWMQQLAYVDTTTVVPTVGVTGSNHTLVREPTPLYDLMPAFWRQQMTQVDR